MKHVNKPDGCGCSTPSPFVWYLEERPSIFARDPYFMTRGTAKVAKPEHDEPPLKPTAEDRMMAVLRLRTFHVYNRAGTE